LHAPHKKGTAMLALYAAIVPAPDLHAIRKTELRLR
jgi:hypothetical protein